MMMFVFMLDARFVYYIIPLIFLTVMSVEMGWLGRSFLEGSGSLQCLLCNWVLEVNT